MAEAERAKPSQTLTTKLQDVLRQSPVFAEPGGDKFGGYEFAQQRIYLSLRIHLLHLEYSHLLDESVIKELTTDAMHSICGREMDEARAATNTVTAVTTSPTHYPLWISLCEQLSSTSGLACIEAFINAGGLDAAGHWVYTLDPNIADTQQCVQACLHTVLITCMRGVRHHRLAIARHGRLLPAVIKLMKSAALCFQPSCLRIIVSVVDLAETQAHLVSCNAIPFICSTSLRWWSATPHQISRQNLHAMLCLLHLATGSAKGAVDHLRQCNMALLLIQMLESSKTVSLLMSFYAHLALAIFLTQLTSIEWENHLQRVLHVAPGIDSVDSVVELNCPSQPQLPTTLPECVQSLQLHVDNLQREFGDKVRHLLRLFLQQHSPPAIHSEEAEIPFVWESVRPITALLSSRLEECRALGVFSLVSLTPSKAHCQVIFAEEGNSVEKLQWSVFSQSALVREWAPAAMVQVHCLSKDGLQPLSLESLALLYVSENYHQQLHREAHYLPPKLQRKIVPFDFE